MNNQKLYEAEVEVTTTHHVRVYAKCKAHAEHLIENGKAADTTSLNTEVKIVTLKEKDNEQET